MKKFFLAGYGLSICTKGSNEKTVQQHQFQKTGLDSRRLYRIQGTVLKLQTTAFKSEKNLKFQDFLNAFYFCNTQWKTSILKVLLRLLSTKTCLFAEYSLYQLQYINQHSLQCIEYNLCKICRMQKHVLVPLKFISLFRLLGM